MTTTVPLVAEALGLRWTIQIAKEKGLEKPLFKTDAAVVVDCLFQKCFRAAIDLIIQDCRILLLEFVSSHVMFVRRAEIGNAHQLLVGIANSIGNHQWLSHEQLCSLTRHCNWPLACSAVFI